MARQRTRSKPASEPKDRRSLRWFRERCAQERGTIAEPKRTAEAAVLGAELRELANDAGEYLPSALVPLLP